MHSIDPQPERPPARGPVNEINVRAIITENSLDCAYQPIVSVRERKILGLEALARARDPRCGRPIPACELFRSALAQGCCWS
jgi:EAL domain-containing protein (putative c-di-GMP-specific phosphodiesterase class I)